MNHAVRYIGAFSALPVILSCGEQISKKGKSPQLEALQKSEDSKDKISLSLTSLGATNGLSSVTRLGDCSAEEKIASSLIQVH
jgi:hypothetical protein